jgi:hypothetical protein
MNKKSRLGGEELLHDFRQNKAVRERTGDRALL